MKILTLNTWQEKGPWRLRWKVVIDGIKETQPDLVAFQEVFNPDWAQEVKGETDFPYLVFHPEPSGLMLLSRFSVLQSACLTMKTQSPTEDYLRYALFAEIGVKKNRVAVFNTHLSWQLDEGTCREKQVGELLGFINRKTEGQDRLVMGDFNAPPETPEIKKMNETGKFIDTFGLLYPKKRGWTWDNDNPYARNAAHSMPERRIDYIFTHTANSFLNRPKSVEIIFARPNYSGIWASDHLGLLATFEDIS